VQFISLCSPYALSSSQSVELLKGVAEAIKRTKLFSRATCVHHHREKILYRKKSAAATKNFTHEKNCTKFKFLHR
jgi:hypothetical protein